VEHCTLEGDLQRWEGKGRGEEGGRRGERRDEKEVRGSRKEWMKGE
jgi:hypothetical protein